jgi:sodium-coupled neutral amino acid transporter 11
MLGAGLIGLGGAIANSGGLISIVSICIFAILSKFSFDLIVGLAIESEGEHASSYESLGYAAYGRVGKLTVIISKGLYSFGTLVAYIVIIKDNFSFAIVHLLYGDGDEDMLPAAGWLQSTLGNQNIVTIILCSTIMLPLCLLRDLTPLERFSALKIIAVMLIVVIVVYLFFAHSDENSDEAGFGEHWMVVRGGMFERYVISRGVYAPSLSRTY